MSEPVSNAEIEDVLSSIRRLVSENAGAIKRGADDEDKQDKLVLTPAFRVDEADAEADDDTDEASGEASVVALDVERWSPEETRPDDATSEDDAAHAQADRAPEDDHESEHGADHGDAPELSSDQNEDATTADAPDEADDAHSLQSRVAQLEAAIDRSGAEWEPDGSEPVSMPDTFVFQHETGSVAAEAEPEIASVSEPEPEHAPELDATDDAEADEAVVPQADPEPEAAPEVDVAHEADAAHDEAAAPEQEPEPAEEWEDVALAEAPVGPQAEPFINAAVAPSADAAEHDDDFEEDMTDVIDEDMLREMVTRMVRQELQGSVGERITHNVRRLVRREIARALALKDFE